MGLKGTLTIETEINGSADKYYSIMKTQAHHFQTISPEKVASVELHEGDWHEHGAIKIWTYNINGKTESIKEQITHDDETKTVTLAAVGGDPLKAYMAYKGVFQAIHGEGGEKDSVRVSVVYEKYKESDPAPVHYFEFLIQLFIDDFDQHLVQA